MVGCWLTPTFAPSRRKAVETELVEFASLLFGSSESRSSSKEGPHPSLFRNQTPKAIMDMVFEP